MRERYEAEVKTLTDDLAVCSESYEALRLHTWGKNSAEARARAREAVNIEELLDEAKKEFPKPDIYEFDEDIMIGWYDSKEVNTWFKKWFGDEP
jgi:hypothetical protein